MFTLEDENNNYDEKTTHELKENFKKTLKIN